MAHEPEAVLGERHVGLPWPKEGDGSGWSRFIRYWEGIIRSWCRNAGLQRERDRAGVEDVVQGVVVTIVRLFGEGNRFSSIGEFGAYLSKAARSQISQYWRSLERMPVSEEIESAAAHERSSVWQELLDAAPPGLPDDEARIDWLLTLVDDDMPRRLIQLRMLYGMGWELIGETLGVPHTTLHGRLGRELEKLRERLPHARH